jgi:hypothetical protein
MKKSFKKLTLNKKTILSLNQAANIRGGDGTSSGVETCGGYTTAPCCPKSVSCPPKNFAD